MFVVDKSEEFIVTESPVKFYEPTEVFKKLSEENSDILFLVERYGEENLDITRTLFKNGKVLVQDAIIAFPEIPQEFLEN